MVVLKQPKVRASGAKVTIGAFEVFHDGARQSVDEAEVDFGPAQAGHWFYVQLVRFKALGDYGFHVSEGVPGTGPATSQDTPEIAFVATVLSGNVNSDGSGVEYFQYPIPSYLMEVK